MKDSYESRSAERQAKYYGGKGKPADKSKAIDAKITKEKVAESRKELARLKSLNKPNKNITKLREGSVTKPTASQLERQAKYYGKKDITAARKVTAKTTSSAISGRASNAPSNSGRIGGRGGVRLSATRLK